MAKTTVIDFNPVQLKYYSFMISLRKCTGSCNVLTSIISVPKETKYINVKAFNMIANRNQTKTIAKYISCGCKCKFNTSILLHIIHIKTGIMKHVIAGVKIVVHTKKL